MRTTIDIADDVLFAAKDYARRDKMSIGQVITQWGRQVLSSPPAQGKRTKSKPPVNTQEAIDAQRRERLFKELGFKPFPSRVGGGLVTNEMVNRIREEEGI